MANLEKREERRPKETEGLVPQPVPRMKEVPTRIDVEAAHPPKIVAQRLRENMTPPEKTLIGRNAPLRLGEQSEKDRKADGFRNVDTVENFRKAITRAIAELP